MADLEEEVRAGSRVLEIFVNPLNARILRAHAAGSLRLTDLNTSLAWYPESTVRAAVLVLCEEGALSRGGVEDHSCTVATELTPGGRELLFVASALESWLARAPLGPIALDSDAGKSAVKALAGGWSTKLIRVIASRSMTLTELSKAIPEIPYPVLERRIAWMRSTGQIEIADSPRRGTPYEPTDWLRQAIGPLSVSGRCERRHFPDGATGPITETEVEASFLLAIPLIRLSPKATGACLLATRTDRPASGKAVHSLSGRSLAGVMVSVAGGKAIGCETMLDAQPHTWAIGSAEAWLDAVIDADLAGLRVGGERPRLALDLVGGIHRALF